MSGKRKDPLTTFQFAVTVNGVGDSQAGTAFFKSVTGLKAETDIVEYVEGGQNTYTHKLRGHAKFPNLILKQGFTGPPFSLIRWRETGEKKSGTIRMLGNNMQTVAEWEFTDGWPCKWEGPDLDASKNELAIETIEIAHHGLKFKK